MPHVVFFDLGNTLVAADNVKKWQPNAKNALTGLHQSGMRLGVISNTGDMKLPEIKARLPGDFPWDFFTPELIVLSGELEWAKPQLEIFRHAIRQAGITGGQCLYCSEDLVEALAAQCAGMHAARITPGDLLTFPAVVEAAGCPE